MFKFLSKFIENVTEQNEDVALRENMAENNGIGNIPMARKKLTLGELLLLIFVIFLSISYLSWSTIYSKVKVGKEKKAAVLTVESSKLQNTVTDPFLGLTLEARAVYVFDVKSQRPLFSKNENIILPLASLTKIMTILTASEILPKDTIIKINKEALQREGDTGLYINEEWKLNDLIDLTLVSSSNDGAYAIASSANLVLSDEKNDDGNLTHFVRKMNEKAQEIGLSGTHYNNETGLDESNDQSGGYGTARDMAMLFSHMIGKNPELLEATRYENLRIFSQTAIHNVKNTSSVINSIPSTIGSKTGYTDLAQGNMVIAFDAGINYPVIIVVLGSTYEGRFNDIQKLSEATLQYLSREK